jgi:hypothetical protein
MSPGETLVPTIRPLTPAERDRLSAAAAEARTRSAPWRPAAACAAVIGTLWALTLLASDAPWPVVTLFWTVTGLLILVWVQRDARRDTAALRAMAQRFDSALEHDRAEVFRIEARAYAELEEIEDEGACYAFDLGDGRIVFLTGQEFYPDEDFPCLAFSLVSPLDDDGQAVDCWVETHAERSTPERVVPGKTKHRIRVPEHLSVVHGTLGDLEQILSG